MANLFKPVAKAATTASILGKLAKQQTTRNWNACMWMSMQVQDQDEWLPKLNNSLQHPGELDL